MIVIATALHALDGQEEQSGKQTRENIFCASEELSYTAKMVTASFDREFRFFQLQLTRVAWEACGASPAVGRGLAQRPAALSLSGHRTRVGRARMLQPYGAVARMINSN